MITLKEGDFGSDLAISYGADDLLLPDPDRPGLKVVVPLAEVAEMDAVRDDRSKVLKQALKLSANGLLGAGPAGLAAGIYAVTKVKDVVFSVRLKDGRSFVAITDAKTYADLHAAQIAARGAAAVEEGPSPADDIIARYLEEARANGTLPPADAPVPEPAGEPSQSAPAQPGDERQGGEQRPQRSFGRRRG